MFAARLFLGSTTGDWELLEKIHLQKSDDWIIS